MTQPNRAAGDKRPPWIFIAVIAVVVVAGVIAVIASRGGDEAEDAYGPMPKVTGQDFAGQPLTFDPADGKAKIIIGVAHWCPHCQAEVPRLVEHLAANPLPEDVELLTVSTALDPARGNFPPQAWLEAEGWTAPVIDDQDGAVATELGIQGFPYFLVVDAEGEIVDRTSGEKSVEQFDAMVEAAQAGADA